MSNTLYEYGKYNTIVDAYSHFAKEMANKVAYTYRNYSNNEVDITSITFGELDRKARSLAAYLTEMKVLGERIVLLFQAGIEYIEAYFGCLYAGAIPVPAYPPSASRFFSPRLHSMIPDSGAKFVLTTSEIKKNIETKHGEFITEYALTWMTTDSLVEDFCSDWRMPAIDSNSIAFLQYTSGSTSVPKGVIVTHDNLLHNISLIGNCIKPAIEGDDHDKSGVIWLPPYHDMGLIGGILSMPCYGVTVHLMSPFAFVQKPFRWLEAISQNGSQVSAAPNFAFDHCVKSISPEQRGTLDLSCWKVVCNGAEPINPKSLDEFTKAFECCGFRKTTFFPCYGLAEASLIVSGGLVEVEPVVKVFNRNLLEDNIVEECGQDDKCARKIVGCGTRLGDEKILIVNPNTFEECDSNCIGEIWVKSPSIAKGYWNKSELTEETFNAHVAGNSEDSFLRTGDLGFIYEDQLYITGRLKDLIIIDGRNINPSDIERTSEIIHESFCKNSSAAFSIDVDGEEKLVVVQEIDRKAPSEIAEDLKTQVKSTIKEVYDLSVYDVVLVKRFSLKKTSSGKIQRRACKEDYLNSRIGK